ncbi:MAG: hypothetical protein J3R72DRAFT_501223 [Linnemannia gamsii]|nr:MAG: hypothetical protein J3R72DRAFT_501223 [Linnemannia gamsii]
MDSISAVMASNKALHESNMALQESFLAAIRGLGPTQRHQDLQGQQAHWQCEPVPVPVLPVLPLLPVLVPVPIPVPAPAGEQSQSQQEDVEPPPAPHIPTVKRWQDARKLIAKEFDRVGRNEDNMNDIHGEHAKSVRYLTESIHGGHSRRKAEAANKRLAVMRVIAGGDEGAEKDEDNEEDEAGGVEEEEEESDEEECSFRRKLPTPREQPAQLQQKQQSTRELEQIRGKVKVSPQLRSRRLLPTPLQPSDD